jgi:hypothetical protein
MKRKALIKTFFLINVKKKLKFERLLPIMFMRAVIPYM